MIRTGSFSFADMPAAWVRIATMWRIPLSDLNYDHRESAAVQQVLDSGWLTMGPQTRDFEKRFADAHQGVAAVAVANCTCALELVYRYVLQRNASGRCGVVVPDITFVATASAVISAGGVPVLCDVTAADSPALSYTAVERLLSERDDIAAVALVHYAGHDAGAEAMAELCEKHGVLLIEDCAHSPGATTKSGRALGTVGFAGCFSFFSNKNLSTGEGGMIVIGDQCPSVEHETFIEWLRMARSHGTSGGGTWQRHVTGKRSYDVEFAAWNYRCTEITAVLGLVQLEKLETGNQRRRDLTNLYIKLLEGASGISVLVSGDLSTSACHILPLLVEAPETRQRIATALTDAGIQTSHHYPPIHTLTAYSEASDYIYHGSEAFPNADAFAARELTLPLHPKLSEENVREITDIIRGAVA